MMKNKLKTKRIVTAICLLVTVGILCLVSSLTVFASNTDPSNVLSITMNDGGNGEINGSLRILLTEQCKDFLRGRLSSINNYFPL